MIIPTDIDFLAYLGQQEASSIHWGRHWTTALVDRVANGPEVEGDKLPWNKTYEHVRLRPGEISIWAGINGHRKSMILGQVALHLAKKRRVCIASLEMHPVATLERMVKQSYCQTITDPITTLAFAQWTENRICIYDQLDTVAAERILGMVHYAAVELRCAHIIIDSLTKCGLGTDDYTAQKQFVDRLAWAAKAHGVHVHLVCHMRKGSDENHKPGKFDVRGASEITDLADNVFICWKNLPKETAKEKRRDGFDAADRSIFNSFDQLLTVAKQRHGEYEGSFGLWLDINTLQFLQDAVSTPQTITEIYTTPEPGINTHTEEITI